MAEKKCCAKKGGFALLIVLIAIACFIVWNNQKTEEVEHEHYGIWFDTPKAITTPFTLESTQGGNFTEQSFKGHWSWVFFGFTHCPNMCPTTMKAFKEAVDQLRADKVKSLPEIILVSLDPERDTLLVLQKYVTSYDPSFIGLVGSMDQVDILTKQMEVSYKSMGNGMIQHSGNVTVVNPEGEIQGYFPWMDEPVAVAKDYEDMLKANT